MNSLINKRIAILIAWALPSMRPPNGSESSSMTPYASVPRFTPTKEKDLARKYSCMQSPASFRHV